VPLGYLYFVMTNGFGVMPSYAAQVPVEDRWAIAAYIRALQLSQHYPAAELSAEERARLDAPAAEPAAPAHH
jgi:mono/diheme cytochrome c family protein